MTIELQGQPAPDGSRAAYFTPPPISHLSHVAYLVGDPIAHSSSPKLHDTISRSTDVPYAQILAETTDLPTFVAYLRDHPSVPKLLGSGVTMPHKVSVLPYLDHLTPEAQSIGAVNTIFLRTSDAPDGRIEFWGTNTDTIGIRDAFISNLDDEVLEGCRGRPGLIVGGGGTCRAAVYALESFLGCSEIYIINRDTEEVQAVIQQQEGVGERIPIRHITSLDKVEDGSLEPPGLVISAIPDYPPSTPSESAVRKILEALLLKTLLEKRGAVLEMCYHPSPDTGITRLAHASGWKVIGGLGAMVAQGLEQARLWLGEKVDQVEGLRDKAREGVAPR
jgi:quinate dehydrogenase